MSQKNKIKIMAIDDHHLVRRGIVSLINQEPDMCIVADAGSGEEAIALYRLHLPDVTLMDLRMPGMGGVEAIKAIRGEYPNSRFIVLTTYDGDEDIYTALQAGAQGYLLKGVFHEVLVDAIRAVHAGLRRIPPEIAGRLALRTAHHGLTPREIEVLKLVAKGMSDKEIAGKLAIGEATVRWFVKNIRSKLGVNDRTLAVTTALQRGIIHLD
jgi:DNA-binding NarL/FixJ family response regulator